MIFSAYLWHILVELELFAIRFYKIYVYCVWRINDNSILSVSAIAIKADGLLYLRCEFLRLWLDLSSLLLFA